MKKLKLKLVLFLSLLLFAGTALWAQQEENEDEKKVIIITKTIDEDGNELTNKIIKKEGEEEIFIMERKGLVDEYNKILEEIEISEATKTEEKRFLMKIDDNPGDMEMEITKWNKINADEAPNKACLGVMIGKKEMITNNNGEETISTEGGSEFGVSVLDVIAGSGAEDAGLTKDDIITAINGAGVSSIRDVLDILSEFEAGASVEVDYLRDGQAFQVNASLKACENKTYKKVEKLEWTDEEGNTVKMSANDVLLIEKITDEEPIEFPELELLESLEVASFTAFPNPTDGKITLNFTAPIAATTLTVVDIDGRELYNEELINFDGVYNKEIDLKNGTEGIIILSIRQGEKVFSEKIILKK